MQGGVAAIEQVVRRLPGTKRPYTLLFCYLHFTTYATLCYSATYTLLPLLNFATLGDSATYHSTNCSALLHTAILMLTSMYTWYSRYMHQI